MFAWLGRFLDPEVREASGRAMAHLAARHDGRHVHNASLRAVEDERFVFAVFYSVPKRMTKPTPYALVAVPRPTGEPAEIRPPSGSPYWIRGRK